MQRRRVQAFTLIEMMVVISVIAILMLASFRMLRAAAYAKKVTETQARLERIQNALAGYYAVYAHYPEVPFYMDLNPDKNGFDPMSRGTVGESDWERKADLTVRYLQPVAFEYPTPNRLNKFIPEIFKRDVVALNAVAEKIDYKESDWATSKIFRFGLVSFLLPRLDVVGVPLPGTDDNGEKYQDNAPLLKLFTNIQWIEQSADPTRKPGDNGRSDEYLAQLVRQQIAQREACVNWLPHLAGTISGYNAGGACGGLQSRWTTLNGVTGQGREVAVLVATVEDAWDHEFYYYSPPPYQSYRIWSAGGDGKTYPPWISSNEGDYTKEDRRKKIAKWTKDDIVGGSY